MADSVTSETLVDGPHNLVISDGSGESAVTKVDASALSTDVHGNAVDSVIIEQLWWNTVGMSAELFWNASTNVSARKIKIDSEGYSDYRDFGGLVNNAGSGVNGDVLLTTTGHSSGDTYDIIVAMKKVY